MKQVGVYCTFTLSGARSLSRVLQHVINNAEGTGASAYGIDTLCRDDCARRWRELRAFIDERIAESTAKKEGAKSK